VDVGSFRHLTALLSLHTLIAYKEIRCGDPDRS
jgi:hypothetical protein